MHTHNETFLIADINTLWSKFNYMCITTCLLTLYRPVFNKFLHYGLTKLYNDGVMFVELRHGFHALYKLNGIKHAIVFTIKRMVNVTAEFQKKYPDFIGIKIIECGLRHENNTIIAKALNVSHSLQTNYPFQFAGFDLVQQEDLGRPLFYFARQLLKTKRNGI